MRQFGELIRAGDRLSFSYSSARSIIADINALGRAVGGSYGLESKFSILYQLLDKKIQKGEDFIQCVNSYNDIVLMFLGFKTQSWYRELELKTINTIDTFEQTRILNSSSDSRGNILSLGGGAFKFKNETHLTLQLSLHFKIGDKSEVDLIGEINPNETKTLNKSRQFYQLLVSEKEEQRKNISAILKTVKAGYGYKIVIHKRDMKFLLISL